MGDILAFWSSPLRFSLLVTVIIVVFGMIMFARRPKLKKTARAAENTAKHPSEYSDLPEFSRDVGKVVIKKRVSVEEQVPLVANGVLDAALAAAPGGGKPSKLKPKTQKFKYQEAKKQEVAPAKKLPEASTADKLVILHMKTVGSHVITGQELMDTADELGFQFGKYNIFHYFIHSPRSATFSLSNMIEPGFFDLKQMNNFYTSGLSLFFVTTGDRLSDDTAFTTMLKIAHELAVRFDGILSNEHHEILTESDLQNLQSFIRGTTQRTPEKSSSNTAAV